nr:glutamate--tRNA ligase [Sulfurovaceae bacterium]
DFNREFGVEMRIIADIIADAPMIHDFNEFKEFITKESGLQYKNLLKPLRCLLTGEDNGPELSKIYPLIKSYILEVAS